MVFEDYFTVFVDEQNVRNTAYLVLAHWFVVSFDVVLDTGPTFTCYVRNDLFGVIVDTQTNNPKAFFLPLRILS